MTIFLVICTDDAEAHEVLDRQVRQSGLQHIRLPGGEWLVSADSGTEAADVLRWVEMGEGGSAGLVVRVTDYSAFTCTWILEWLEKSEAESNEDDC